MPPLETISRAVIRVLLGIFTAVVLLLLQSAFWSNRVSLWMQLIILATALVSYFRPQYGLLALAALAPLGQVGSRTLDSNMRGAEALALAFLAGALVRGWTLRGFRTFPSNRLHVIALSFGFVVTASCIEQIWYAQVQLDFAWLFAQDFVSFASRNYIASAQGFGMLFRAMLLLEGVALLIYVVRYAQTSATFVRQLAVMLVVGAAATATLTFIAAWGEFVQTRQTGASMIDLFARGRWSGHISDLNGSGSYFAMTGLLAIGIGFVNRQWRAPWIATGVVLFAAMLITGSRTAVASTGLVGVLLLLRFSVSHPSYSVRVASALGAVAAITVAALLTLRTTGGTPSQSVSVRWLFLQTTASMLRAEPAFGVGVGQYALWSAHFAPPALLQQWRPDNAHNYVAQIAGELGLVGLATFLLVMFGSLRIPSSTLGSNPLRWPLIAGLAAFILTWMGGHPLLVPEVAYPFWIALGLAASVVAFDSRTGMSASIASLVAALLLVSIPFRVSWKSAELDFTKVSYGLSGKQLMTSRARFFVPASASQIDIPLRGRNASDSVPVEVELFVDGAASTSITLSDRNWQRALIDLPRNPSRRFHQIDLRIKPHALDYVDPDRSSVHVGKWEIISKPNG